MKTHSKHAQVPHRQSLNSPQVMPHDVLPYVFSFRQNFGEMFRWGLGIAQLHLIFCDLTGDWALAVVAFISEYF